MMRIVLLFTFLWLSFAASPQFLQDVTGQPYLQKNLQEYEGSPLLFSSWVKADVITASGNKYSDMLVNVDVVQDQVLFLKEDKTLTFSDEINEFIITDGITKLKFKRGAFISPSFPRLFMEVMSDTVHIIKKYDRALVEVPTYASANKRYRYAEAVSYFAFLEDDYKKITLTKENAKRIFVKKWKEVETYAEEHNVSFKKDEGWRKLIQLYQTTN